MMTNITYVNDKNEQEIICFPGNYPVIAIVVNIIYKMNELINYN